MPKFLLWSPAVSPKLELVLVFIHSFRLRSDFLLTSLTRPAMALPGVAAGVEMAVVSPVASHGLRRENMLLLLLLTVHIISDNQITASQCARLLWLAAVGKLLL